MRIFSAWNVTVRFIYDLPRKAHRYFIVPVSNSHHPKVMLAARLVRFRDALIKSNKMTLRILAKMVQNDHRTTMGNNLSELAKECGLITPRN